MRPPLNQQYQLWFETYGTLDVFTELACVLGVCEESAFVLGVCGGSIGASHLLRPLMPAMLMTNEEKVSLTVTSA